MTNEDDAFLPTRWSLINRLKDWNDQESWRQFFDTYWRLILSVALKAGLTHAEAQDVVQETVIAVCKHIGGFKADPEAGSFKSWLLQQTRWRIKDQVRKRRHSPPAQPDRITSATESTAIEDRLPDPAGNILDAIWEDEWRKNLIAAALDKVRPQVNAKHFQVFLLHVIKALPAENVARASKIDVNQVYLIKHRLKPLFEAALQALETQSF
ncbi:MAG: sigma-70 family RNA polymerase sigma factor [Verrucomicrobiota bacterium]